MAKEPQRGFPMSDDLRAKVRMSFRGAQRGPRDDPDRLERYLLLGYALGSLQKYDLIPTIRDGIGAGWVAFYNELWRKVTDPRGLWLEIRLPDESFIKIPYSILNPEFNLAMDLFKLYGLQHGRQFSDFNNLSEANYYYSNPAFEKLVNDFLVRRELERQEAYAIQEEIHMEDCSEEISCEEPTPIPIIPESTPTYIPTPGYTPTHGPASGSTFMPQQPYAPQSGFVPTSAPAQASAQAPAPEPVKVDKVPKKEVMMTERQKEREKQKKKERRERKEKKRELRVEKEMKEEIKRLEKKAKERVEKDESGEKPKEDEPIEISPVKEKEMAPKESTKVLDETDLESESEMEPESDFEESFEKKPLAAMAKRTKRMERERKRKEELAKPRENQRVHDMDRKRVREAKKNAKEIFPEIKKMKERIKKGDTDDMEVTETQIKPKRKEESIMTDERRIQIIKDYVALLDKLFEVNHDVIKENRFHEPRIIYNKDEEFNRIIYKPDAFKDKQLSQGTAYHQSPLEHYFYLGEGWWYNASLSDYEMTIINFLKRFETDEGFEELMNILKNLGLIDYLNDLGTPLERELTIKDIKPFRPEDCGKGFLWSNTERDIAVDNNAVYVRIPGIKRNDQYLFYKIIPNLPTKPSEHQ